MAELALSIVQKAATASLQAVAFGAISRAFDDRVFEGARLNDLQVQTASEGVGIPLVFGRVRLTGSVIWAARLTEEVTSQEVGGGKGGGPTQTGYRYTASFAIGLCEGEIDGIGRIWANGEALDTSQIAMRLYRGTEAQEVDALIAAVEGADSAPAFRGVAYLVIEDLPLDAFGNRLPQISVEVMRRPRGSEDTGPALEELVRGVTLIPGSGEFAYATTPVMRALGVGEEQAENVNSARGGADIEAALDTLAATAPNLSSVTLVVSWFGDDLRCGSCTLKPGVDTAVKETRPVTWSVGGVMRNEARLVSQVEGRPAYGGTPSDASILEAIAAIRARGWKVGLLPFILMDVPADNALPDPYGGTAQAAYPWRGRITCDPAPGIANSVDQSASARTQITAFVGTAQASDFTVSGGAVSYSGPAEWSFSRFILHYAHLAKAAGGVELFALASELRGLTRVRDEAGAFPMVDALCALAGAVRAVLPAPATTLTYGADWSEYGGYVPPDSPDDLAFPLDALWAHDAIDAVGLDWYPPMADWRDEAGHLDGLIADSPYAHAYLQAHIEGGEGYDWYYASAAERTNQVRTPITDGTASKPWVYRVKDLSAWWSNAHYPRTGGVEASTATPWVASSKPILFLEVGCPAVDKGANQPNVFYDPKSAESAVPHFSTGARDDLIQRRALEAFLAYWDPAGGKNPSSSVYGAPMIDVANTHVWTWDARPFPDFPARDAVWGDGGNWRLGHWITGRLGIAPLAQIVDELLQRAGIASRDVSALNGLVAGFVLAAPQSVKAALSQLAALYQFDLVQSGGLVRALVYGDVTGVEAVTLSAERLIAGKDGALTHRREATGARAHAVSVEFYDETRDYRRAVVTSFSPDAPGTMRCTQALSAPVTLDPVGARALADDALRQDREAREVLSFALAPSQLGVEVGDWVEAPGRTGRFRITRIEEGMARRCEAVLQSPAQLTARVAGEAGVSAPALAPPPRPALAVVDAPSLDDTPRAGPLVAVAARPWSGDVAVLAGADASTAEERVRLSRPGAIGTLNWALYPGPVGRWDEGADVEITLSRALSAVDDAALFSGANRLAVKGDAGGWEILQAGDVTLVGTGRYRLRRMLRGLAGSEAFMGASPGAPVVLLDQAVVPVALKAHERAQTLAWTARLASLGAGGTQDEVQLVADTRRDQQPLAPVHLRVRRSAEGLAFSWVRRTRVGGDDWAGAQTPLGEAEERYQVVLVDAANGPQTYEVTAPSLTFTKAEETALYGPDLRYAFALEVRQWSASVGWGSVAAKIVYI